MTESLGNLVKVKIRTRWPNEAADFTPWLALEENMSQLGDAIGLELETERTQESHAYLRRGVPGGIRLLRRASGEVTSRGFLNCWHVAVETDALISTQT